MSNQRNTGSGRRPHQSQPANRRRPPQKGNGSGVRRSHKRKRYNWPVIITYLVILLLIIGAAVFMLSRWFGGRKPSENNTTQTTEMSEIKKKVTVEGISITGMTKEEARAAVLEQLSWSMKAQYDGSEYEISNFLELPLDMVLEEIFEGGDKSSYLLDTTGFDAAIQTEIEKMGEAWDVPAKDAAITEYDAENNKFLFSREEAGRMIDREQLALDVKAALGNKAYDRVITVNGKECQPELTEEVARASYKVISTFETKTTANKDRNTNIRLAAEAINGHIIPKGETFSINDTTGERTYDKGYRPAGAYVNGVLVEEPGGGVCQVSSTLYNAVIFSGLNTTERYAHSYVPSYVNPGEDAMISFPNLDMKFENNTIDSVGILASFSNQTLKISIYGIPVLEEGVTLEMRSELTETLPLDPPTYEEDPTLQPGEEITAKEGTAGTKYVTYLITKKNGEVVNEILLHNSRYRGKAPVIRRNTSGIAPESTADPSAESPSSDIQDGTLDTVMPGSGATQPENTAATTTAPATQDATEAPAQEPDTEGSSASAPESSDGNSPKSPIMVDPR